MLKRKQDENQENNETTSFHSPLKSQRNTDKSILSEISNNPISSLEKNLKVDKLENIKDQENLDSDTDSDFFASSNSDADDDDEEENEDDSDSDEDDEESSDETIDFEDTPEFCSSIKSLKSILKNPKSNAESNTKLNSIFESLLATTNPLAILLEHNYKNELASPANDLNILKGNDLLRYNLIKSSCQDRYCFNIATVTLLLFEAKDYDKQRLTAEEEKKIKNTQNNFRKLKIISQWFGPSSKTFEKIRHNDNQLPIQFDAIEHVIAWSKDNKIDYWDFCSINPKETCYIRHVLTFWPIKQEIQIISSISNETAIDMLEDLLNKISTKTTEFTENFTQVLKKLNHLELNPLNMIYYEKLADMLSVIKNPSLIKLFRRRIEHSNFNTSVKIVLRILNRENLDLELFKPHFKKFIKNLIDQFFFDMELQLIFKNVSETMRLEIQSDIFEVVKSYNNNKMSELLINNIIVHSKTDVDYFEQSAYQFIRYEESAFFQLKPATHSNIHYYCYLTQLLVSSNRANLAEKFLKDNVLPILNNITEFRKIKCNILYCIAETLIIFDEDKNEIAKFKDLLLDSSELKFFLKVILANRAKSSFDKFNSSKQIMDLFVFRLNQVDQQLKDLKFDLAIQDASFPGHKEVEDFLKSNQKEFIYYGTGESNGKFSSIIQATSFVSKHIGVKKNYSTKMSINMTEEQISVKIVKTNKYIEKIRSELLIENDSLESFVLSFVKSKF
jgi:hypothetical protein